MIDYSIMIMSKKPGTKKQDFAQVGTAAYGTAQIHERLDINKFAKHIADHGSVYSRGDIVGLITMVTDCLKEQMLLGNKVILGDFGSFYPELQTTKADATDEFTAANIDAVNVTFVPGPMLKNLRDEAEFNLVPSRKAQADAVEVIRNEETIEGLE